MLKIENVLLNQLEVIRKSHFTVFSLNSVNVSTRHESRGRRSSIFRFLEESLWGNDFGTTKGSSQCIFVVDHMTCVALNSGDADLLSSNNSRCNVV